MRAIHPGSWSVGSGAERSILADYPSRETALAIIEAMKNPEYRWGDVEKATGLDNALYVADRCFMIYGFPELEPGGLPAGLPSGP